MDPVAQLPLAGWASFYVIVGSSAAALIGLQFVVIVLGAEVGIWNASAGRAFGTPTIVHFCAVLLVAAVLVAPWQSLADPGLVLTVAAICGVVYSALVIRHARRQTTYTPVLEDWLWYCVFPIIAYGILAGSAMEMRSGVTSALFVIGATVILLLLIGIHNSWDSVTYIAAKPGQASNTE